MMEAFDYKALDKAGKHLSGTVMAASARDARDILRLRTLIPIDLSQAKTQKSKHKTPLRRKVKHRDLTRASRQMAFLIGAATPVEDALKIVALQFERSPMRSILLDVRAQVQEGTRLSDALRGHAGVFGALYIAMIASGEATGQLGTVLERLANDLEAEQKMRSKVLAATTYPMVLSLVAIMVVTILMVFVVPKVVAQFDSFGQQLPLLTRITIALSHGLKTYGLLAIAFITAAIMVLKRMFKRPKIQRHVDAFILRLPFVGRFVRNLNAARFARTMASLLQSGTPALAGFEIARNTLKNGLLRERASIAATHMREGKTMSASLKATGIFPPLMVQMVAGGETSGDVGTMFSKTADYLESDFGSAAELFTGLLEPVIIILLSGVVMLIIAAIFLPILRMSTLSY